METLIRSMISAGPAENRPPHRVLADEASEDECDMSIGFPLRCKPIAGAGLLLAMALMLPLTLPLAGAKAEPPIQGHVKHFRLADAPKPAPDAAFSLDGEEVTLADYAGKVVVLNFWATWCAPCIKEMPALDRLNQALDQGEATVLTVSTDRNAAKVQPFLDNRVATKTLPAATDPKRAFAEAFGVRGLPTTFIIGADGVIAGVLEGPAEWDTEDAKALIRYFVDAGSS